MSDAPVRETVSAGLEAAGIAGHWIAPDKTGVLGNEKGAYVLLIRLDRPLAAGAGRTGSGNLPVGTYFYAGSAYGPGGLAARLKRHFRKDKTVHWHIDRLTLHASNLMAFAVVGGNECELAERLLKSGDFEIALEGFGSTDCRTCDSHLLVGR